MGEELTYFSMAENDYQFLSEDVERGRVANLICYSAQNICERYLKHVITECTDPSIDTTTILRSHSLRTLLRFLKNHVPEFSIDAVIVSKADGYYFTARYPGVDAYNVDKSDVDQCWEAVTHTRGCVLAYMRQIDYHQEKNNILNSSYAQDERI